MSNLITVQTGGLLKVSRKKSQDEQMADLQARDAQLLLTAATSAMTIATLQSQNAQMMLALAQLQMGGA
jgi:hypothetical protein